MADKKILTGLILSGILAVIAYANSLTNGFGVDDPQLLLTNTAVHGFSLDKIKQLFTSIPNGLEYLPIRDVTYSLDYWIWGLNPFGYHLANLIYYLFLCLVLYLFLLKLLKPFSPSPSTIALFSTALFAVHPVHVESVAGIAQRKDLISAIFLLLSLHAFLSFKEKEHLRYYVLSIFLFILAMLSKLTVVVAPLLIIMLDIFHSPKRDGLVRPALRALPYLAVSAIISLLEMPIIRKAGIIDQSDLFYGIGFDTRIYTAFKAVCYYLKLLLLPYPLYFLHPFHMSTTILDPKVIFAVVSVIALIVGIVLLRSSKPIISIAASWYLICLLPVIGLVPAATLVAERYLILPSVGFCLFIGYAVTVALNSGRRISSNLAIILFSGAVVSFLAIGIARNRDWQDHLTLLRANVAQFPTETTSLQQRNLKARLYVLLGKEYYSRGMADDAFAALENARALNPAHLVDLTIFAASNAYAARRYDQALAYLDGLRVENKGEIFEINFLYAKTYEAAAEKAKALHYYERAMKSRLNLGLITSIKPQDLEQSILTLSSR